ncbi:hypothetical protein CsSME_00003613 [Camellia sinensis var. sinensis]
MSIIIIFITVQAVVFRIGILSASGWFNFRLLHALELMSTAHLVTSFKPDMDAPRQRPVDMAPHPEYKSSKVIVESSKLETWEDFAAFKFPSALFELTSLIADASLSVFKLSVAVSRVVNEKCGNEYAISQYKSEDDSIFSFSAKPT